jgi:adenylate kinase family enzyme
MPNGVKRRLAANLFSVVLFGPADALPPSTRRILVAGASGAGKTTLREIISDALQVPTVEINSLYHGPDWTVRPTFISDVDQFTSGPAWVVEWQYSEVKPLLLSRSDALVWLDHSRWTVMRRVVHRTLHRQIRREQLWNGNYEPPLWTLITDPEHVVRWSWQTHNQRAREALAVADNSDRPIVVRLSGQTEVDEWLLGPLSALTSQTSN